MTRIGVLLIQLGTPDEPTPAAVRRYLREFLGDARVVELPRWLWWFILNCLILPRRAHESASKYARIWDPVTGSPLMHLTRLQCNGLQSSLPGEFIVQFGMRYGQPSIDRAVSDLTAAGVERIIVLPMYPQYSAASTGTALDQLFRVLMKRRYVPAIRVIPPFYDDAGYIRVQAELIRVTLSQRQQPPEFFLFSYHGCPVDFVRRGDPYRSQVEQSAQLLARALGLKEVEWRLTYQSRFGRQAWLEPYTEEMLCKLARQGVRRVLIASPGFTTDCLETIDEIGRELDEAFREAGGAELIRCPCLNDSAAWIGAMKDLVLRESQGWYPIRSADDQAAAMQRKLDDDSTVLDFRI